MTARTKIILSSFSLAIAAAMAPAAPALAQTSIGVGAQVKDVSGGTVGTITSVEGDSVILRTDRHDARLAAESFAVTEGGLVLGMTQAELNAEIDKAEGDLARMVAPGAAIRDTAGAMVGTIETVEGDLATVKLPNVSVQLPVSAFAAGEQGLVIGMTVAEIEAQVAATQTTTN